MALRKMFSCRMRMEQLDSLRELQKSNHLSYTTMLDLALEQYIANEKEKLAQLAKLDKAKKKK